jgi:DNA-binding SARP family transcriptional activator
VEFHVLGPVEVVGDAGPLHVASGRQTALLALLLIHAGRPVTTDRIIDALWADEPPESGAKTVAFHVSKLRDALAPGRAKGGTGPNPSMLGTAPGGYVLRAAPGLVDAARFEALVSEGHTRLAEAPASARAVLAEALALWRGQPYAQVADELFAVAEVARLDELRLRAEEDLAEATLAEGEQREVVAHLEALVAANPLRERMRALLALALYRAGRQADALRTLADGRAVLSTELGIDPGPELRQLEDRILRQDPTLDPPSPRRPVRNPYKGLRPFDEADAADFFGREALVARLVDRLAQVARAGRLLVVVGPSGCGKSSTVRAGLLPALRVDAIAGASRWRIATLLPGAAPFRALDAALRESWPSAPAPDPGALEEPGGLARWLAGAARVSDSASARTTLLVIDQLEELFTLAGAETADRFLNVIVEALADADSGLLVVAALRADYLGEPLRRSPLGELVRSGTEIVTPLTRDELERAITRPADGVGVALEPGLAAEVIADARTQPGELPLLQFALTELLAASDGRRLTRAGYREVGGVGGAMARTAEASLAPFDDGERETARQVFLRLVALSESGVATGRRVERSELHALAPDGRAVDAVVDALGARRLLSFDRDPATGAATVEVAHDALLVRWQRLAGWIETARDDLRLSRRLGEATADWLASGRDRSFLLTGSRLELFAAWASSTSLRLPATARGFLDASLENRRRLEDDEAAREARERSLERRAAGRLRQLVAVLVAAVLVVSALAASLFGQGQASAEAADVALARERASAAMGRLDTDPSLAVTLADYAAGATARHGYITEEAFDALASALEASHVAFPASPAWAVRVTTAGTRGAWTLAPEQLVSLAAASARQMTTAECSAFLHVAACPALPDAAGPLGPLLVRTAAGPVTVARLASATLAGTTVSVATELPIDLAAFRAEFTARTSIAHDWSATTDVQSATGAAASGPDVVITARPREVVLLGRAGRLVDVGSALALTSVPGDGGGYLARLSSVGADGSWPAGAGRRVGVPFAIASSSLVWYPRAAFAAAGYAIPATWGDLDRLTAQMLADGRTPWCIGIRGGAAGARQLVGLLEDALLGSAGPAGYDAWAIGGKTVPAPYAGVGLDRIASVLFSAGNVSGDLRGAQSVPPDLAAWQLSGDPPACWLAPGSGTDRLGWYSDLGARLAAFTVPPESTAVGPVQRGELWTVVVLHDRPEVRALVKALITPEASLAGDLANAGLWQVGSGTGLLPEAPVIAAALAADRFRVSASDLVSQQSADGLAAALAVFAERGKPAYFQVLGAIYKSWTTP